MKEATAAAAAASPSPRRWGKGARSGKGCGRKNGLWKAALPLVPALIGGALAFAPCPARADTTGGTLLGASAITQIMLGHPFFPFNNDAGIPDLTQDAINSGNFAFIKNEYIGVVMGFGDGVSARVNGRVPGRITFGNQGGNLRGSSDDFQALDGFGVLEYYEQDGDPYGYGVWPLAYDWRVNQSYDYCSYIRAQIDGGEAAGGEDVDIVGADDADWVAIPQFRDNVLVSRCRINDLLILEQRIRLIRGTARLEWRVINEDTLPHQVRLRYTINNRAVLNALEEGELGPDVPRVGIFYRDSNLGGVSDRNAVYGGASGVPIPDSIEIYGNRYETDVQTDPQFHSRHLLRGGGATTPDTVWVTDSDNCDPDEGGFEPDIAGRPNLFEDGIATNVYYTIDVPAARQITDETPADVVIMYGNGSSSDDYGTDVAVGTEAEESFRYLSGAATPGARVEYNGSNYPDVARSFLTPGAVTVFGSLYNLTVDNPLFNVDLRDVRMSVTLPQGLRFSNDPTTGQQDVSTKTVGLVRGDSEGRATWRIEPTGDVFGSLVYQLTVTVTDPNPISRTVSRVVNIPATPLYPVTADAFQMIGFPFQFDSTLTNNADPNTVINRLSTGTPDTTSPFYRWSPNTTNPLAEGSYIRATTLEPGVGYFYRPQTSRVIFAYGAQPLMEQAPLGNADPLFYQRTLEQGWNMISNPFLYEIPLTDLRFVSILPNNPDDNLQQVSFSQAISSGLVRGGIFFWNPTKGTGGGYDLLQVANASTIPFTPGAEDLVDVLRPWQGYWIYLNERRVLRIAAPTQRQSAILPDDTGQEPPTRKKKKTQGILSNGRALPANPTMEDWRLQLVVRDRKGRTDDSTLLGVSRSAKDGDDTRDLHKPPSVVGDYVYASVVRTGSEVKEGVPNRLAQELKAPNGGEKTWHVEVNATQEGPVTVAWPNLARLPKQLRLVALDESTGRRVNLRNSSAITMNVSPSKPGRLTITSSRQMSQPLAINSFRAERAGRAQDGSRPYNFSFNVTADATVSARILTITGREMGTIATGRSVTGGRATRLYWNGRTQDGGTLAVGPYQVEITARTESGDRVTVKRTLMVLR